MSSEIEVVDEEAQTSHGGVMANSAAGGMANGVAEGSLRNDVYTAAAYGDFEKLQRLVESDGCSVSEPDGLGYYALQWAALNNRTAAAQYIIQVLAISLLCFYSSIEFVFFHVSSCLIGHYYFVDCVSDELKVDLIELSV